jgi:predicted RNase H-like HicB family nuclease
MKFRVVIERGEDGYYVVTVPSLPGCISQGKTKEEALKNIKEAIELYLEVLQEKELKKLEKVEVEVAEVIV